MTDLDFTFRTNIGDTESNTDNNTIDDSNDNTSITTIYVNWNCNGLKNLFESLYGQMRDKSRNQISAEQVDNKFAVRFKNAPTNNAMDVLLKAFEEFLWSKSITKRDILNIIKMYRFDKCEQSKKKDLINHVLENVNEKGYVMSIFDNIEIVDLSSIIDQYSVATGQNISIVWIGNMFSHCESLTKVIMPDFIKIIPENMFRECFNLTVINIPESIERIEEFSFWGCSKLKDVSCFSGKPSLLKYVGERVFVGTKIENIKFPESLEDIGEGAFELLSELKTIDFTQNGDIKIGKGAFNWCNKLHMLKGVAKNITKQIKSDELRIFDNCPMLNL